jgi:hypothetical protein
VLEGIPADSLFLIIFAFVQLTVCESWSSQVRSATAILAGTRSGASDFFAFFFGFLASGDSSATFSPSSFFFLDFLALG